MEQKNTQKQIHKYKYKCTNNASVLDTIVTSISSTIAGTRKYKITITQTQIHKYTNTQIHKYTFIPLKLIIFEYLNFEILNVHLWIEKHLQTAKFILYFVCEVKLLKLRLFVFFGSLLRLFLLCSNQS